jgi:hypothetical protein
MASTAVASMQRAEAGRSNGHAALARDCAEDHANFVANLMARRLDWSLEPLIGGLDHA